MAYTQTTSTSFGSRLGSAFKGILFGIVLIVAGTILLWWNEGDFVATGDALREAQTVTQELGDISRVDVSKNGQLVHATGPAETKDILTDPIFGLSINAIRLERTVEFYQWTEQSKSEKKKKLGGGEETVTTYTYSQKWSRSPVSSSSFKDPDAQKNNRNFILANVSDFSAQATNVSFGAYRLPGFMINSIGGAVALNVDIPEEKLHALNKQVNDAARQAVAQDVPEATEVPMVHVSGNTVLLSKSLGMPAIGDVRITFSETRPDTISILSKVNGDTFEQYVAKNGKTVSKIVMGKSSLENMYDAAHSSNVTMTWILRFGGAFLVILGLVFITAPLGVLASVIPILGDIVGAGTGIVSTLLGLTWSLIVISIAWLRFRPVIGILMIAVAVALIVLLYLRGHSRKAAKAKEAPAAAIGG